MNAVLHIGMPKTGSTALQDCLLASRDRLAAQGVLYPSNPPGCPFNNHRMLIFGFTAFGRLPRHVRKYPAYTEANLRARYAEFRDHLARQVAETRPDCTILSSETLFRHLSPAARYSLQATLAPLGPPVVAVYLRRPSEYYLASLQQKLRSSYRIGLPRPPAVMRVLQGYARSFGAGAVRPRLYDRSRLENGDIVADFLHHYLPGAAVDPGSLARGSNPNATVSAESMDLLCRFRRAFHPEDDDVTTPDSSRLVHVLHKADRAAGAKKPRLRPEIAEMIDYGGADPLALRDGYGLEFPDFDYRQLERRRWRHLPRGLSWDLVRWTAGSGGRPPRLADIMVIDPEVRQAIAQRVTRSGWAKADPARRRWIDSLPSGPDRGSGP